MSDHRDKELKDLNNLVIRLAHEIDYKNHLLMEKEGLSLERFATISSLLEEKDRLLDERASVIGSLMAEKHRLNEAFAEEMRKSEYIQQQMEKHTHEFGVQKRKLDQKAKQCDPAKNEKGVGSVTDECVTAKGCFKTRKINRNTRANNQDGSSSQDDKGEEYVNIKEQKLEKEYLKGHGPALEAQLDILKKGVGEKSEQLHSIENLNQALILKERSSNEELQAARREAIKFLLTMDGNGTKIGIKRIGEIDPQPFRDACFKKFCGVDWKEKSDKVYSSWTENLDDASWNPFKKEIICGELSEVVDENDKKLAELRKEWGEEAYRAVVDALVLRNEYNPGGGNTIPELWNFDLGRRAYLKEVIKCIIQHCETQRQKDSEQSAANVELMEENERLIKRLTDLNTLMGEKEKLLSEKYAAVGKLMAQDAQKGKLIDKLSENVSTLTTERDVLLETCSTEKRKAHRMNQQIEKLKHELQSQEKELTKQIKELMGRKGNNDGDKETVTVKMENADWLFDSSSGQVEPLPKNLEGTKAQNCEDQSNSTSEDRKFQNQKMRENIKEAEADMQGEQLEQRCDVSGALQPITHPPLIPFKTTGSSPSSWIAWDKIYQMAVDPKA